MDTSNDYLGTCSMLYFLSQTEQENSTFSNSMFSDRRSTDLNVKGFFISEKTRITVAHDERYLTPICTHKTSKIYAFVQVLVLKY